MAEASIAPARRGLGRSWHIVLWSVILAGVAFGFISRIEFRDSSYVEAGKERASHVLDRRMERAKSSEDPIVRLQSWAYINSLQQCMLRKSGIFQTSMVDRNMMVAARSQRFTGVEQKLVGKVVERTEADCNGSLLKEVAMTNPAAALALAAELNEQGLILPLEVMDGAQKDQMALAQMTPLTLSVN